MIFKRSIKSVTSNLGNTWSTIHDKEVKEINLYFDTDLQIDCFRIELHSGSHVVVPMHSASHWVE